MNTKRAAAAMDPEEDLADLLYTPTWAVAVVCAVFILSSLVMERTIFLVGHVLQKHNQTALSSALEKIKEELMVVGFTSLALTVGQRSITRICIPTQLTQFMRQCTKPRDGDEKALESLFGETTFRKGVLQPACAEGKAPFIRKEGLHQLHILLFFLAIVHIIYSIIIMALGTWKVHQWSAWEERALAAESLRARGQIRLTRDVTFIRRHASGLWSRNCFTAYVAAFFHQFFFSISEPDYLTLRHGFIKKHMLKEFDFHKYILKTLEDDFRHVVGVSPSLWGYMVLLTFLNVQGWGMYFWASFIPLIMVMAIGTKLRHIITRMAVQCFEKHAVVEGLPDVKPTDELFWFRSPRLILYLIHFILFQDALNLALHLWTTFEFSEGNCFYKHPYLLLGRLLLGALAQLMCGYVMLPIYALVSQMGSEMKGNNRESKEKLEMAGLKVHEEEPQKTSMGRAFASRTPNHQMQEFETVQKEFVAGGDGFQFIELEHVDLENQGSVDSGLDNGEEEEGDDHHHQDGTGDESSDLQKKMSFSQRVAPHAQGGDGFF